MAKILAAELPERRFKLLLIHGGFGDEGMRALGKSLPALLTRAPLDPKDVSLGGALVSDETAAQVNGDFQQWVDLRRTNDPRSLVNQRDCLLM